MGPIRYTNIGQNPFNPEAGKEIAIVICLGESRELAAEIAQSSQDRILPISCTFGRILHIFGGCKKPVNLLPRAREE